MNVHTHTHLKVEELKPSRGKFLSLLVLLYLLITNYYLLIPPASADSSWWNGDWKYRRKLTFQNSGQSENLVNFPIMVKLNSTRIDYAQTQDNGADIRFIDADGITILPHEIEQWNESGDSFVWVKVPQINGSSSSDYIWLYWGNPLASDGQNVAGTWDGNFVMVQHLSETSGQHLDSTSNNNNSVTVDVTTQGFSGGQINGSDSFDGINDYVLINSAASLNMTDAITLEGWVKPNPGYGEGGAPRILNKGAGTTQWLFYITSSTGYLNLDMNINGVGRYLNSGKSVPTNTWSHVAATFDGTTRKIFMNSVEKASNSVYSGTITATGDNVYIGNRSDTARTFNGIIDEVRISNTSRSADWVAASYASMNDSFIEYTSETSPSFDEKEEDLFEKNKFTDSGMPSFVFKKAQDKEEGLDKEGIDYYQVVVNDGKKEEVFIDHIAPDKPRIDEKGYGQDYREDDGNYIYYTTDHISARSKTKELADGAYKWKARSIDKAGNFSDSQEEVLRVNTYFANFSGEYFPLVLSQIGERNLNLNSFSPEEIKDKTYYLSSSTPTFSGIAALGTKIQLTIKRPTRREDSIPMLT